MNDPNSLADVHAAHAAECAMRRAIGLAETAECIGWTIDGRTMIGEANANGIRRTYHVRQSVGGQWRAEVACVTPSEHDDGFRLLTVDQHTDAVDFDTCVAAVARCVDAFDRTLSLDGRD